MFMILIYLILERIGFGKWKYFEKEFEVKGSYPYLLSLFCRENKYTGNTFYKNRGINATRCWKRFDKQTKFYN